MRCEWKSDSVSLLFPMAISVSLFFPLPVAHSIVAPLTQSVGVNLALRFHPVY